MVTGKRDARPRRSCVALNVDLSGHVGARRKMKRAGSVEYRGYVFELADSRLMLKDTA